MTERTFTAVAAELIRAIETLQRANNAQGVRLSELLTETRGLRQMVDNMGTQLFLQQQVLANFSQTFAAAFHQPWNQPPQPPPPAPLDQPLRWKTPPATPPDWIGTRLANPPNVPPSAAPCAAFIMNPSARAAAATYAAHRAAALLGPVSKAAPLANLNMQPPPPPCPQPQGLGGLSEEDLAKMLDMTSAEGAMPHAALRPRIAQLSKEMMCKSLCPLWNLVMEELLSMKTAPQTTQDKPCFKYLRLAQFHAKEYCGTGTA